jgi:hypothetical protein
MEPHGFLGSLHHGSAGHEASPRWYGALYRNEQAESPHANKRIDPWWRWYPRQHSGARKRDAWSPMGSWGQFRSMRSWCLHHGSAGHEASPRWYGALYRNEQAESPHANKRWYPRQHSGARKRDAWSPMGSWGQFRSMRFHPCRRREYALLRCRQPVADPQRGG